MGGRAGVGRRLALGDGSSSIESSAISTNSKSRIRFTTLAGSEAAGLKGPFVSSGGVASCGDLAGGSEVPSDATAAAASNSRPEDPGWLGEKIGREEMGWLVGRGRPAEEASIERCCIAMAYSVPLPHEVCCGPMLAWRGCGWESGGSDGVGEGICACLCTELNS